MKPVTDADIEWAARFKSRVMRAMMKHKAEIGLGDDSMVTPAACSALLKVPSIRHSEWLHGEEQPLDR